jgi:hypothetical protein
LSVSRRKKVFFFSIFLFAAGTAYAQQSEQTIEFFEKSDILQRISWPPEEDVLKYQLVIEKKDETGPADSFTQVVDISTEETSVELSLAAGEYRYRVIVYDLLRRRRPVPEWSRLKVLEALQPEISAVNPQSIDVNDDTANITLNFEGNNLTENAEVFFLHVGGGTKTPGEAVLAGKDNYLPSGDGKSARLKLNGIPLTEGIYDIVIKNPGGLSAAWRNFMVTNGTENPLPEARKHPLFEMLVSAGYAALFPVSGSLNELFDSSVFPAGLTVRLGGKTYEKRLGALGLESAVYWHYMSAAKDAPLESGYFFSIMLDLLYQKKIIQQKAALNARLGGGFSYFYGIKSNENLSSGRITGNDTIVPALVFSLSCSWFFHKYTFLDFAVEYTAVFPYGETVLSYVRPLVSIGLQF